MINSQEFHYDCINPEIIILNQQHTQKKDSISNLSNINPFIKTKQENSQIFSDLTSDYSLSTKKVKI